MKAHDLFSLPPGSRILLGGTERQQEQLVTALYGSVPEEFRKQTELNSSGIASMELFSSDDPSVFPDLIVLCRKLIVLAGKRSHFEGILFLNVSGLMKKKEDAGRLKALGEMLAVKDGLASRCVTVIFGPATEEELIETVEYLDFDGRLLVDHFEPDAKRDSLTAILARLNMRCDTEKTARLLNRQLKSMADMPQFQPERFLQAICDKNVITEKSVREAVNNPYSYINRIKKMAARKNDIPKPRLIGFQFEDKN